MLPLTPGSHLGPEGVEPSSGPYKEPALAVELRASRAGGSRTHTLPLKRRIRCHYATAPRSSRAYRFQRIAANHFVLHWGILARSVSEVRASLTRRASIE